MCHYSVMTFHTHIHTHTQRDGNKFSSLKTHRSHTVVLPNPPYTLLNSFHTPQQVKKYPVFLQSILQTLFSKNEQIM